MEDTLLHPIGTPCLKLSYVHRDLWFIESWLWIDLRRIAAVKTKQKKQEVLVSPKAKLTGWAPYITFTYYHNFSLRSTKDLALRLASLDAKLLA